MLNPMANIQDNVICVQHHTSGKVTSHVNKNRKLCIKSMKIMGEKWFLCMANVNHNDDVTWTEVDICTSEDNLQVCH